MIFNSLHFLINSFPRSVNPGPVSGELGKLNGTPCPKILGLLQTGPIDRTPNEYKIPNESKFSLIASAPSICNIMAILLLLIESLISLLFLQINIFEGEKI